MKNRKKTLTKSIGLLVGTMSVATIPIIATSCGTTNELNNSKAPYLKKDSTVHVSYGDVFNEHGSYIQQSLNRYFSDNKNIQNMLSDETKKNLTQDELNSLTAQINTNDLNQKVMENNFWGSTPYETWSNNLTDKYVYQPQQQMEMDVDNGLHKILKSPIRLLEMLKNSKKEIISSSSDAKTMLVTNNDFDTKIVSLNENNQPKIVNNAFHIAVNVSELQNTKTIILEIPFSTILLNIKDFDLSINSNNNNLPNSTRQKIDLKLTTTITHISPNQEIYSKGISLKQTYKEVTRDNFINSFNLSTNSNPSELNNENVSNFFGIYNVNYSNLNIEQIVVGAKPGNDNYNGLFNISVDATPVDGYFWDDGKKDQKTITLSSIPINLKLSEWKQISGIDAQYTEAIRIPSLNQEGVDKYFSDSTNKDKFLKSYAKQLEGKELISYIDFKLMSAKFSYSNGSSGRRQIEVTLTMTPKLGCTYIDGFNSQNNTINVLLTNVDVSH